LTSLRALLLFFSFSPAAEFSFGSLCFPKPPSPGRLLYHPPSRSPNLSFSPRSNLLRRLHIFPPFFPPNCFRDRSPAFTHLPSGPRKKCRCCSFVRTPSLTLASPPPPHPTPPTPPPPFFQIIYPRFHCKAFLQAIVAIGLFPPPFSPLRVRYFDCLQYERVLFPPPPPA